MKILYLAHSGSPHTQKWVRHFVKRGDEVHVASLFDTSIEGAIIHPFRRPTKTKLDYFANLGLVKKLTRELKPDILHAHYATSYGYLGARSNFHPFVITVWGSDVLDFPKTFLNRGFLRRNLAKADAVTAASRHLAEATDRYLPEGMKTVLSPFGIDMETFRPAEKNQKQSVTVGIVKSLEPVYGHEYLLRAFAKASADSDTRLLIVGGGSLRTSLEKLAKDLRIISKVEFAGPVPHREVPTYFNKIDILVNPSLRESFGVSVLETSACERPVIVSNIGGLPEVVQDGVTGFLVPPRDVEALAEKLQLLIKDAGLRQRMGKAGREFVKKNYDWNENAKIMEELYDSLVKK